MFTSKEKHSLTRKLVGHRNWRQWWCKKEGNKVLRKGYNETKILCLALLLVLLHLHVLNIGFILNLNIGYGFHQRYVLKIERCFYTTAAGDRKCRS